MLLHVYTSDTKPIKMVRLFICTHLGEGGGAGVEGGVAR
jgi:hypothetical protein